MINKLKLKINYSIKKVNLIENQGKREKKKEIALCTINKIPTK